jgi:hypothetical protein
LVRGGGGDGKMLPPLSPPLELAITDIRITYSAPRGGDGKERRENMGGVVSRKM